MVTNLMLDLNFNGTTILTLATFASNLGSTSPAPRTLAGSGNSRRAHHLKVMSGAGNGVFPGDPTHCLNSSGAGFSTTL